jgi:hypothetical protein
MAHRGRTLADRLREQDERNGRARSHRKPERDPQPPEPKPAVEERKHPLILITTKEEEVNDQAVAALASDMTIYQRTAHVVRVIRDASPAADGIRRPFAPRIDPLPAPVLRERLAACADWFAPHETMNGTEFKAAHPPTWCVSAVHSRANWSGIRHLEAVVDYPVLRPDGSLLSSPGFDSTTGLLLEFVGTLPPVPEWPSKKEATSACDALFDVVNDFPFERPIHRAAWLAALLTPLARFAFVGPAPLFLVDANVRAAGKGLLLNTISRILTGESFTIATYTDKAEELRKRITALVLAGDRLVLFDNIAGNFGSAVLDAALTGTSWRDRVLGFNRMAEGPMYMTWYATGNNVQTAADTARRTCHIRLESNRERPEERNDFHRPNLLAWVAENRLRLLTAALTILRGYCAAGRPDFRLSAWGSFEGWSRMVRSAVVWIDLPDPGETRLLLQERADPAAESIGVLLTCWEQIDPERRGLTAAELIQKCKEPPVGSEALYADVRDSLEGLLGKLDARALGTKLRSYRRRVFQGRFVDRVSKQHQASRWAVFPASHF